MRSLCGLNDGYQNARERTLILSAAAEGVDRSFRDKRGSRLAVVAGIVGAGILGFTVALLFAGSWSPNSEMACSVDHARSSVGSPHLTVGLAIVVEEEARDAYR